MGFGIHLALKLLEQLWVLQEHWMKGNEAQGSYKAFSPLYKFTLKKKFFTVDFVKHTNYLLSKESAF